MQPTIEDYHNNPEHYKILGRKQIGEIVYSVSKVYPDFTRVYLYDGGKKLENSYKTKQGNRENFSTQQQTLDDSLRRTKTTISDIVISNKFDMFATFTFSCKGCTFPCIQKPCTITKPHKKPNCNVIHCNCPPELCNRLDPEKCKIRMSKWLENQQKIHGKFLYIIVPEWHENGGLHFHAMIKNYKGKTQPAINHLTRLEIENRGQKIYTCPSYRNGYTTIKNIPDDPTDHAKVSNYIKKYIVKDMPQFKNRKRYWCSMGLLRPHKTVNDDNRRLITDNPYLDKTDGYKHGSISIHTIKHNIITSPLGARLGLQNGR